MTVNNTPTTTIAAAPRRTTFTIMYSTTFRLQPLHFYRFMPKSPQFYRTPTRDPMLYLLIKFNSRSRTL